MIDIQGWLTVSARLLPFALTPVIPDGARVGVASLALAYGGALWWTGTVTAANPSPAGILMELAYGTVLSLVATLPLALVPSGAAIAAVHASMNTLAPKLEEWFRLLVATVFFTSGAALSFVGHIAASYRDLPAGLPAIPWDRLLPTVVLAINHALAMAVVVALPAIFSVTVLHLLLGLATRSSPHFQPHFLAMPLATPLVPVSLVATLPIASEATSLSLRLLRFLH